MARKTTGNTTTTRGKKTGVPAEPAAVQVAPEVQTEVRKDARKNGKPANLLGNVSVNLEEEIRRPALQVEFVGAAANLFFQID